MGPPGLDAASAEAVHAFRGYLGRFAAGSELALRGRRRSVINTATTPPGERQHSATNHSSTGPEQMLAGQSATGQCVGSARVVHVSATVNANAVVYWQLANTVPCPVGRTPVARGALSRTSCGAALVLPRRWRRLRAQPSRSGWTSGARALRRWPGLPARCTSPSASAPAARVSPAPRSRRHRRYVEPCRDRRRRGRDDRARVLAALAAAGLSEVATSAALACGPGGLRLTPPPLPPGRRGGVAFGHQGGGGGRATLRKKRRRRPHPPGLLPHPRIVALASRSPPWGCSAPRAPALERGRGPPEPLAAAPTRAQPLRVAFGPAPPPCPALDRADARRRSSPARPARRRPHLGRSPPASPRLAANSRDPARTRRSRVGTALRSFAIVTLRGWRRTDKNTLPRRRPRLPDLRCRSHAEPPPAT